jgi:hypothetical protein
MLEISIPCAFLMVVLERVSPLLINLITGIEIDVLLRTLRLNNRLRHDTLVAQGFIHKWLKASYTSSLRPHLASGIWCCAEQRYGVNRFT